MGRKVTEWPANPGRLKKITPSDGCKGVQFLRRLGSGTISPKLDVIWGMLDNTVLLVGDAGLLPYASGLKTVADIPPIAKVRRK